MTAVELEAEVRKRLDAVNGKLAVKSRLVSDLDKVTVEINHLELEHTTTDEARLVIAAVEETQQKQLKQKLEKIISMALTAVFEKSYKFQVDFTDRGNQSEATFRVMDEKGDAQEIKGAHGGGLLVVVSFLLRVIILLSAKPAMRRLIVHDEPFIQVSEQYREKLVSFIQAFAQKADCQFLFVTHDHDLASIGDKRYQFKLEDGLTKVVALD